MIDLIVSLMPVGEVIFQPIDMILRILGKIFSMIF